MTVPEYLGLSAWRQLVYRLYRNPIVLFGLGPAYSSSSGTDYQVD
jgi:omega-6 fatty acid desaturase (delta-12 desaturase)